MGIRNKSKNCKCGVLIIRTSGKAIKGFAVGGLVSLNFCFWVGALPQLKRKISLQQNRGRITGVKNWSGKASEETTERNGRLCCGLTKHKWENRGQKR